MMKAYITNVLFIVVVLFVRQRKNWEKIKQSITPPKTYWSIVNKLMGKKKILALPSDMKACLKQILSEKRMSLTLFSQINVPRG